MFDLLKKPNLSSGEIKRIKAVVAVDLLAALKAEKLRIDHWQDKEATRDAVRLAMCSGFIPPCHHHTVEAPPGCEMKDPDGYWLEVLSGGK